MASYLLRWLLALQCVLLAVTPAQAGVTARLSDAPNAPTALFSELLERDATGRVISASATAGPRGTAPDLWRGYRYSSLGRLDRVFKSLPLEPSNGVPLDTSSLAFLAVGSSGVADFADDLGPSATGGVVLHTPGTGALDSSAVQGFDEAVRGAGHRLLSVEVDGTAFELSYDSSGRVATCEATDPEVAAGYRLEWDVLSRLVAVYAGPGPGVLLERYVYDADGRLAGRFAADGTSETYVYSGEQMVEAYDTDGEVLWQALWGPGLDELVEFRNVAQDGPGAPPLLALTDFRRSVVGFLTADEDDALAVEGFVEYGPWGRVESVADSPMGESAGCGLSRGSRRSFWVAARRLIAMQSTLNVAKLTECSMASITIRNLEDDLKRRLRIRAAEHGRSMEEEAREILRHVVTEPAAPRNLAASIRSRVAPLGGVELDLPAREAMREPPPLGVKPA